MRDAQAAIAPGGASEAPSAAVTADRTVRRNTGAPAEEATKSATRRRFQNDMPTQTAIRRFASSGPRPTRNKPRGASHLAGGVRDGSRKRAATKQPPARK